MTTLTPRGDKHNKQFNVFYCAFTQTSTSQQEVEFIVLLCVAMHARSPSKAGMGFARGAVVTKRVIV